MSVRTSAILFTIIIAIFLLVFWMTELYLRAVPEVLDAPILLALHLVAELVTIFILLFGSLAMLLRVAWGVRVHAVSLGLLLYSSLFNAGYFAQQHSWWLFFCFLMVALLSLFLAINAIFRRAEFHIKERSTHRRPRSKSSVTAD